MKALQASSVAILAVHILNAQDALPSWNDTAPKKAIVAFVERVTREGSPETFIVSGGGVEFMRAFAEKTYGSPPKIEFIDDGPGKPVGINRFIGRRPVAAFGNSDGDLHMLQWTAAGQGARLMLLVHHTDSDREYVYDRESHVGKLDKALDEANSRRWVVVYMKNDWNAIFTTAQKLSKIP